MDKFDTLKKRGENIVDSSRIYYGETRVNIKELIETNRKGFIKLEYYGTKQTIENEHTGYGIEIVKKEYINKDFIEETNNINNITNDEKQIEEIISLLKRNKFTPMGLEDIISDLVRE